MLATFKTRCLQSIDLTRKFKVLALLLKSLAWSVNLWETLNCSVDRSPCLRVCTELLEFHRTDLCRICSEERNACFPSKNFPLRAKIQPYCKSMVKRRPIEIWRRLASFSRSEEVERHDKHLTLAADSKPQLISLANVKPILLTTSEKYIVKGIFIYTETQL